MFAEILEPLVPFLGKTFQFRWPATNFIYSLLFKDLGQRWRRRLSLQSIEEVFDNIVVAGVHVEIPFT